MAVERNNFESYDGPPARYDPLLGDGLPDPELWAALIDVMDGVVSLELPSSEQATARAYSLGNHRKRIHYE